MLRSLVVVTVLVWAAEAGAQDHQSHDAAGIVALYPAREVSGTAWQPDLTPMYGFHGDVGGWTFMVHANVFAQYLYESGEVHRTSRQAGSINWFMGMLRRPAGRGRVGLRAMLSLESSLAPSLWLAPPWCDRLLCQRRARLARADVPTTETCHVST